MALKAVLLIALAGVAAAQDEDPFHGYTFACSTAMECVDKSNCDYAGVITNEIVNLDEDLELRRAPLLPCLKEDKVSRGVCCRDPNYVDPWPNGDVNAAGSSPGGVGTCPARNRTTQNEEIVADFAEYPWQGAVLDSSGKHLCSCSYSQGYTCFTTIECIAGLSSTDIKVGIGKYTLSEKQTPDKAKIVGVTKIYTDKRYSHNELAYNVAVLKLAEAFPSDYHIKPICLDREQAIPTEKYEEKCVITGWGAKTKHEKNGWVYVDLLSSEECKAKDASFDARTTSCARTTPGEDACKFDLGSGYQCPRNEGNDRFGYFQRRYYLKGVLSKVEDCGNPNGQVVFFSKIDQSAWLTEAINAPLYLCKEQSQIQTMRTLC